MFKAVVVVAERSFAPPFSRSGFCGHFFYNPPVKFAEDKEDGLLQEVRVNIRHKKQTFFVVKIKCHSSVPRVAN